MLRSYLDRPFRGKLNLAFLGILALPAHAEPVTIAALGDSLTQGFGLPAHDGFVPQMQRYLDAAGADVVLVNAGVSGDTTAGGRSRIDWTLTPDVDGVIVALGGNDMLRGLAPELAHDNLDQILQKIGEKGLPALLVGMDVPSNFGAAYEQAFEAIYPDLAAKYDALLFPNFLQGLADIGDIPTVMARYMQNDRVHPNAAGVALIVDAMGPSVLKLVEAGS